MRILFNNYVEDATISANIVSLNYPPENLKHPYLKKRYQSLVDNATITVTFDSEKTLDCFFYGLHNMTSAEVRLYDSVDTLLLTVSISSPTANRGREYFTSTSGVAYAEIDITGGDPVYLGGIGFGQYYQNLNFLSGYPESGNPTGSRSKSASGQALSDYIKPLRTYSFSFRDRDKSDKDNWLDLVDDTYPGPYWFDLTECDNTFLPVVYGTIQSYPGIVRNGKRYDNGLDIEEAR